MHSVLQKCTLLFNILLKYCDQCKRTVIPTPTHLDFSRFIPLPFGHVETYIVLVYEYVYKRDRHAIIMINDNIIINNVHFII